MFSTKQNVLQLTSLMLKAGIREVVVCPGSRNIPLVHTFVASGMQCYEVTDERSAGFFALGLIEANGGMPVAVCCTSGSAVLNLAPAVSEAYYRSLPLLVVTADRPQRWIGQMDGQTMNQPLAFTSCIRKVVSLPEIADVNNEEDVWYCNRLINEAFVELQKTHGPVHINVPISEPMFDFSAPSLPDERLVEYSPSDDTFTLSHSMKEVWEKAENPMLIVGQLSPEEACSIAPFIARLAESGCVVLAETLSNLHLYSDCTSVITDFEDVFCADVEVPAPDLVITIGGHIVSKRLKQYLRSHRPAAHWHQSALGELSDLFMCNTVLVQASVLAFASSLADEASAKQSSYADVWKDMTRKLEGNSAANPSKELSCIKEVLSGINETWALQVANSTMIRMVNRLLHTPNPVYCNRGINGIEGSISAAVGYWAGSQRPTVVLTGDLSFFYDQNALWNAFVKNPKAPLRIVIVNNGCGDIFHHLPGLDSPALEQYISASHSTTAEGIALECGARYAAVKNLASLSSALPDFFAPASDVRILEVFI